MTLDQAEHRRACADMLDDIGRDITRILRELEYVDIEPVPFPAAIRAGRQAMFDHATTLRTMVKREETRQT